MRSLRPYANYENPIVSHGHPERGLEESKNWSGPRGYGARHRLDLAPFTLWDTDTKTFRVPTKIEFNWIINNFSATAVALYLPMLIIETPEPPTPLPLTVAGVATKFVPPPATKLSSSMPRALPDDRPLRDITGYAAMRGVSDPLPFRLKRWQMPSEEQLQRIVDAVSSFCEPDFIHVLCPYIIVEIRQEPERTYQPQSIPRSIGGFAAVYHHDAAMSAFPGLSLRSRQRLIQPTATIHDTDDYLQAYNELCPGVQLSTGLLTDVGLYATLSTHSTAGVLLRDNHGHQRLTASNHGFLDSRDIFHPTEHGSHVGEIIERYPHLDIALVELDPAIRFTNSVYFQANPPERLLRGNEIEVGAWYALDGMSTGSFFMQAQGVTMEVLPRPPGYKAVPFRRYLIQKGFGVINGVGAQEGMRGAPMVSVDDDDGGIAGFFQFANDAYTFSACLDELVDQNWSVV